MDQDHGGIAPQAESFAAGLKPRRLHRRTKKAFNPMRSARDHQHRSVIGLADSGDIDGKFLSLGPGDIQRILLKRRLRLTRRLPEFPACSIVVTGKYA